MAEPPNTSWSSTLEGLSRELVEPLTSSDLILAVLKRHGRDYGAGRAETMAGLVRWPTGLARRPIERWFADARAMITDDLTELHGRTLIIGVALADRAAGREVVRAGLFAAVANELEEGLFPSLSPRGRERLASIPIADLAQVQPIVLKHPGRLTSGGLSRDGRRALTFGPDKLVVWNVASGVARRHIDPGRSVSTARFDAQCRSVVAVLDDWSVVCWSTVDGRMETLALPRSARGAALSRDGSTVAFRAANGIEVHDVATGAEATIAVNAPLARVAVSSTGDMIAASTGEQVLVYQHVAGALAMVGQVESGPVDSFVCDGGLVLGVTGGRLSVLYGREPRLLTELDRDDGRAASSERADDNIANVNPTINDQADGSPRYRLNVNREASIVAASERGGSRIVLVHPVGGSWLADLSTGSAIERVTFSLDDRRMLTTHADGTAQVWDVGVEPPAAPPPPSTFAADQPDNAPDLLGRRRDVEAFASLIAARSVQTPLSIGVFGDWGSGKSWFMRQLRRRVAEIAADTSDSDARQRDVTFYKRIAQVEFNAWHYAEGDVLASLVDHVFRRLDLGGSEGLDTVELKRVKQLQDVAKAQQEAAEAERALALSEQALDHIDERIRQKEQLREATLVKLRSEAIAKVAAVEALGTVRSEATKALESAGWNGSDAVTLHDLHDQVTAAIAELRPAAALLAPGTGTQLGEVAKRRRRAIKIMAASAILGAIVAAALTRTSITAWSGLLPLVAGVTEALRRFTTWLRKQREELERVSAKIDEQVASGLSPIDAEIATLRAEKIARLKSVDSELKRRKEKEQAVVEKKAELDDIKPEKLLEDLIHGTVQSGTYASHLGVIAQARAHFEQVSDMVNAVNVRLESAADIEDEKDVQINRIVLYIDDLDRCEPVKVAQVLQAVHLLLALPLFVVVVGVDSRWVGRALQRHYPELLDGTDATPHDYMEKIFQVPFWLDQLDGTKTQSMLRGLAAVAPTSQVRQEPAPAPPSAADGATATSPPPAEEPSVAPEPGHIAGSRELNPKGLEVEEHELDAMVTLAGATAVGRSPRALKRFVNIYRLIKVRAPEPLDFADESRPDADYKVVLLLLARLTSEPGDAMVLFDRIRAAPEDAPVGVTVPDGWPTTMGPYQRWVDDVARFSFRVAAASSGDQATLDLRSAEEEDVPVSTDADPESRSVDAG